MHRVNSPTEAFVENFIDQDDWFYQPSASSQILAKVIETHFSEEELNLMNHVLRNQGALDAFNNFIETADVESLKSFREIVQKNGAENCFAKFGQEEFQLELASSLQEKVIYSSFEKCKNSQDHILDMLRNDIE